MGCAASANDETQKQTVTTTQVSRKSIHFDDKYFTARQRHLIKETWHKVNEDQVSVGSQIFIHLFEIKPGAKNLFPFRDLEGEELLSDSIFRSHAMRFMFAIGNTVNHLDALDVSSGPTFVLLGRKHIWIKDFVSSSYLDAFIESVAAVFKDLLPENESADVYEAWRAVFRFVVGKMIEGYREAEEEIYRRNQIEHINSESESLVN